MARRYDSIINFLCYKSMFYSSMFRACFFSPFSSFNNEKINLQVLQ